VSVRILPAPKPHALNLSCALVLTPAVCLLAGMLLCGGFLWWEREHSVVPLNARLCAERQSLGVTTFSVGAYYRAGEGPLPPPAITSYRQCVYVPWTSALPVQAAFVWPPWALRER
jgi:hypothetical protein